MLKILEFHNICTSKTFLITQLPLKKFENILNLLTHSETIINPWDFLKSLHINKNRVMLTFDDAFQNVYKLAFPLMEKLNLKGTISVIASYVGKRNDWDMLGGDSYHMSWEEIKTLKTKGWLILSHGMTHTDLTKLDSNRLQWELVNSKKLLEDKLNTKILGIAYPWGRYDRRVVREAIKAGYQFGFAGLDIKKEVPLIWRIPRIPVYSCDPLFLIKAKLKEKGILKILDEKKNVFMNKISFFARTLK